VGIDNYLFTSKEGSRWGSEKETMDVLQQFYGFDNGFVQFFKKYFDFAKVSKQNLLKEMRFTLKNTLRFLSFSQRNLAKLLFWNCQDTFGLLMMLYY
jgi:hypothetical protein